MLGSGKKLATLEYHDLPELFLGPTPELTQKMCGFITNQYKATDDPHFVMRFKYVSKGTKVEILQLIAQNAFAQVKVLEGENKDFVGWVPSFFLK